MKTVRLLLLLLFIGLLLVPAVHTAAQAPLVVVMTMDDAISPATEAYLQRVITLAAREDARLIVLKLSTPGGDILSMNAMGEDIRASTVPVVVFVSPRGAMAASAGSIVTLSAHVAAMAPETIIGAASPVSSTGQDLGSTEKAKAENATIAIVTSYAERRGPRALQLAKDMIVNARAVSSTEALQVGLIDFIAEDVPDLLSRLDGFTVQMPAGPLVLHTTGAVQQAVGISFIEQLRQFLIDANIVFLLLAIGVQALLIEFSHPGGWVAGFFGVICLALAAYGLGYLPVNWFGIIFILTAFVLFIIDIKALTHGALTIAGVASFIVGALVLFNSAGTPRFERVSVPLVVFVGVVIGAVFAFIVAFALRVRHRPVIMGQETLHGQVGFATMDIDPTGQVQTGSELWSADLADGAGKIRKGDEIEVVKAIGLRLKVKKKS